MLMKPANRSFETSGTAYQLAKGVAIAGSIFCLTICVLMIIGVVQTKTADPLDMPEMIELRDSLKTQPDNESLREQVRLLDTVARRAYFSSLKSTRTGAALLLAGVILTFAALKIMSVASVDVPAPGASPDRDNETVAGKSRVAVTAAGAILVVVAAGMLLLKTRLDDAPVPPSEEPLPEEVTIAPSSREDFLKNWPSFRGPDGLAIAHGTDSPTSWNGETKENILWHRPVPKHGFNSAVAWGNKVFLTGADEVSREVYCFDAGSGKLLWRHLAEGIPGSPSKLPEVMEDTGFAAATAATDGRYIFAIFATGDIVAVDFDGTRKWARNLGVPKNPYGHASSLITYGGRVLVQYDQEEDQQLLALNADTGATDWNVERDVHASWASPIVVVRDDGADVVLNARPIAAAYNALNGEVKWTMDCMSGEVAPSPAYADGIVYVTTEYALLAAIEPGSPAKIIWETDEELPDIASPLAVKGLLILGNSGGVVTCFDSLDGKLLWQQEFDDGFHSSPVFSSGNVYLMDMEGSMHIFKAEREYAPVNKCALGEESLCTAAFTGQRIFIRGKESLYCIGKKQEQP
jgi:outer membrane protein assembly factor BamB